jgi:DNA-binding transcriptional regulator YiaG
VKGSSDRMKQIRRKLGLSQPEFAQAIGATKNTVAKWERGDLIPPKLAELAAEYVLLTSTKKPKTTRRDV